ncbi:unnamed protein product [Adineta ricciae]|nr:unnamed protein product [Adineta ricciae]
MMIKSLHNHPIFLLTILTILYLTADLPFIMSFIRTGFDIIRIPSFCKWWFWFDYTLTAESLYLAAISSIQRHIVVFHSQWLRSRRLRWMVHYIPLIFCVIYPALFYIIIMFLYPCTNFYDETSLNCMYPCYMNTIAITTTDWIVNSAIPVWTNGIANLLLIVRVIHSKRKIYRQQRNTWNKQKKLAFNLLVYSLLYFLWFPTTIIMLIQYSVYPTLIQDILAVYYVYASCIFVAPLQPFMFLLALPELTQSIKRQLRLARPTVATEIPLAVPKPNLTSKRIHVNNDGQN